MLFSSEKVSTMSTQLSWSHYCELLSIDNVNKVQYYINITEQQNLSVRELRNKIKSNEYERLDEKTKNKIIKNEEINIQDFIKHPIIIKNNNYDKITEKYLNNLYLKI